MPETKPPDGEEKPSKTPILIDLTKRRDVRRVDSQTEVIQLLALERVRRLVATLLREAKNSDAPRNDDLFLDRRHNVMTLHGRRGSGKTTFLLHILELVRESELLPKGTPGTFMTLGIIDPTLIESKENVFVSILALIKQKVDDHKRAKQTGKSTDGAEAVEGDYKRWQDALRKLAAGLTLLDGVGKDNPLGEAWENPTYILEKGLKNAKSGAQLERSFHDFIDESLAFLGCDAFVLALDDIDTDFHHGWAILEVLRKYMTSRKLVIFLCGNLDLYSMLIRNEKWSLFDASLMKKDERRWAQYHDMVGELQSQYLQKVLKPENRVEIRPLSYYVFDEVTYKVEARIGAMDGGDKKRDVSLRELLDAACLNGFFLNGKADRQDVCEILLRQPLRTVIQVMFAASQTLATRWDPEAKKYLRFDDTDDAQVIEAFQDQLPSIFLDNLLSYNLEFDKLHIYSRDAIIPVIVSFLTENDRWQEGYRLKPEFHEDDFSLSALTLGLRFAREANRHPYLLLDYMIKIGLTREGLLGLSARPVDVSASRYIRFVGLDANDSSLQIARKTLGVLREQADGTLSSARMQTGTLSIRTRKPTDQDKSRLWPASKPPAHGLKEFHEKIARKAKGEEKKLGTHYNTLSSLQRHVKSWHYTAITLPAENVFDGRRHSYNYYSIFNLIGVISELMQAQQNPEDVLASAAQLRLFPTPNWTSASTGADEQGLERVTSASNTKRSPKHDLSRAFATALDNWVKHGQTGGWRNDTKDRNGTPLPTHVLAKIWTRFYYTLRQIDHDPPQEQLLGVLFHRSIIALLNAVLVEEDLHAAPLRDKSISAMLLDNPVRSDANFQANLERWNTSRRAGSAFAYPVFTYLFQCPLWALYLAPTGPQAATKAIYNRQLESWRPFVSTTEDKEDKEALQQKMLLVEYEVQGLRAGFNGLYSLLNTIPLTSLKPDSPATVEDDEAGDDDEEGGDQAPPKPAKAQPKK